MITGIARKNFQIVFGLILLAELLSFLGYYYQALNFLFFAIIALTAVWLSLYRLEYGLYLLMAELIIGSFGYLFYFESGGFKISIRVALWLIVMSVWLAKFILSWLKNKNELTNFLKKLPYAYYLALLALFIGWAVINGLINRHYPSNVFFDFNNWLYLLLFLPLGQAAARRSDNVSLVKTIFWAGIVWLSLKTALLAYFFSHSFNFFVLDLYRWIRVDGLGEITMVQGGFYRVFMQSHIFVLIGFFILLFDLWEKLAEGRAKKKLLAGYAGLLAFLLMAIIISFSRSFWLGLTAGGLTVWLIILFRSKTNFKKFFIFNSVVICAVVLSLFMALTVIRFPYPKAYGGFNPADLLSERATQISGEAGASSRWQLLPPLLGQIKAAPIIGQGFGATVTYKTNDPRILASSPKGEYTTYAFEWGWLDIWLKLGLIGLLLYLAIFIKLFADCLKINSPFTWSLACGLVILFTVNIFSPYANHPLGMGFIMLSAVITEKLKRQKLNLSQPS